MVIGLTGGIGSGKTTVARLFEVLGCAVFRSDDVARDIYFDPAVKGRVIELLGMQAYLSEKQLNKGFIGSKIFNDPGLLKKLNAIIHPAVGEKFKEFREANKTKIVIKETALLFEIKQQSQMDKTIVIVADDETRIARVMTRDSLSREEVVKKMNSQLPQEEKMNQANFVIHNNGTEFLITQVLNIYNQLHAS